MIAQANITPKDLKTLTDGVSRVIPTATTIPVLSQIMVTISENQISLRATNLDQELLMTADAETQGAATFLIDAKRLGAFAKVATDFAQIRLDEPEKDSVSGLRPITMKTHDLTLRAADRIDACDFPRMATQAQEWRDTAETITATQDQLKRAFSPGLHCISTEETRYYLNGSYVHRKPDAKTLRVVTTDGHRMGIIDTDIEMPERSMILPTETVNHCLKLIATGGNEPVTIAMNGQLVMMSKGDTEISTKIIDGTYPDYTKVIPPKSDNISAELNSTIINRMHTLGMAMRQDGHMTQACAINLDNKTADITSHDGDTASTPITARGKGKMGINIKYLKQQCRATPNFTMTAAYATDPARCVGDDPDALFVLMPMRV